MKACSNSWRPNTSLRTGEGRPMSFFASPAVRAEARRSGIELAAVASSAGRETLSREDVERHARAPTATAGQQNYLRFWDADHSRWGPVTSEPVPRLSQVAAANLSASQSVIPQVTNHGRADVRRVEAFRGALQEEAAARGIKLTALAFHVKVLARCLVEFPRLLPDRRWRDPRHQTLCACRRGGGHAARSRCAGSPRRRPQRRLERRRRDSRASRARAEPQIAP